MAARPAPLIVPMTAAHAAAVLAIYQAGLDTGQASFETRAPDWAGFDAARLPAHRFVALAPEGGGAGPGRRGGADPARGGADPGRGEADPRCGEADPGGGGVLGWVAASPLSSRCAYAGVVEHSVYVHPAAAGRGVGRALLRALIVSTEAAGIWTIQSGIFPENTASLRLHAGEGFRVVGTRERIGQRHGRWRDVVLMERRSPLVGTGHSPPARDRSPDDSPATRREARRGGPDERDQYGETVTRLP